MANASRIKLDNNIERIAASILAGKELNPSNKLKFPCAICNKNCTKNQACIQCDECDKWCHIKCDGTSKEDYHFYQTTNDDSDIKWYCLLCTMRNRHENFPFTLTDASDLLKINNSDSMEFCKYLPGLEILHETSSYAKYSLPDPDSAFPNLNTSKYHSVSQFQNLRTEDHFNIFHSNVNGLETNTKFDSLHTVINSSKSKMDVIAITETSEDENHSFISNVDMEGYCLYSTPTLSKKGGTALYVNKDYKVNKRTDLYPNTRIPKHMD